MGREERNANHSNIDTILGIVTLKHGIKIHTAVLGIAHVKNILQATENQLEGRNNQRPSNENIELR